MNPFSIKIKCFFVVSSLVIVMSGCSKSDKKVDCHSGFNLYSVTENEVEAFSSAAIDYVSDPSTANCNRYRNALSSYVNALEKYEKCALEFGHIEDWKLFIQEARESINGLQCQ